VKASGHVPTGVSDSSRYTTTVHPTYAFHICLKRSGGLHASMTQTLARMERLLLPPERGHLCLKLAFRDEAATPVKLQASPTLGKAMARIIHPRNPRIKR
jgi:hypothetical protein